jgi:mRNA-degrading endonuclease RelE of RelBE toxin-antitoxin system
MYKIIYASTRVNREIEKIPKNEKEELLKEIEKEIVIPLNKRIRVLEEFKKQKPKRSRLKLDKYRIIFSKDKKSKIITIYEITPRKDAYKSK